MRIRPGSIGLVVAGCFAAAAPGAAEEVLVGAAQERLQLPARVPLAGYSRRKGQPSVGEHDPITVRAVALQDGDTSAVLVGCDLLIIDERLFAAIHRRVVEAGLPASTILLLAATHTHSGPGGYGTKFVEKVSMGHFDPKVFGAITEAATRAIIRARGGLRPARLLHGARRVPGLSTNRVTADGMIDDELVVVGFQQDDRADPTAVLVGFSAHPTTLGAWNRQLSADYPGVLCREVEKRFPATTCLFLAGSVGDQAPIKQGEGFERAERIGQPLAQEAVALIEAAMPEFPGALDAWQERMALPAAQVRLSRWLRLPRWFGARLVDDDATLTVVVAGRVAWIGVPCDLFAALGETLKQAALSRGYVPFIVGFANDYIGYCVPESVYRSDEYEALMAFNGPATGPLIVARLIRMLDQLPHASTRDQ